MVVLRSLFFIALIPGTVAGVIPWLLVQSSGETVRLVPSLWHIGLLSLLAGLVLFFWCNGLFTFVGKGTLAPIDSPIFLVRAGPYHWIRNPMYVAVLTIILSEAILFHSLSVVGYALAFGTFLHLWVMFVEEPSLREQFGESYETYLHTVPRYASLVTPQGGSLSRHQVGISGTQEHCTTVVLTHSADIKASYQVPMLRLYPCFGTILKHIVAIHLAFFLGSYC